MRYSRSRDKSFVLNTYQASQLLSCKSAVYSKTKIPIATFNSIELFGRRTRILTRRLIPRHYVNSE